jgi:hypothetical protein
LKIVSVPSPNRVSPLQNRSNEENPFFLLGIGEKSARTIVLGASCGNSFHLDRLSPLVSDVTKKIPVFAFEVVKNRRDWAWKKNYFFDHH